MSERRAELQRLSQRSRDLLEDIDSSRQDLLSVGELNRTLRQILRNQVALLDALAGAGRGKERRAREASAEAAGTPPSPSRQAAVSEASAPTISLRERAQPASPPALRVPLEAPDEGDDPRQRDLSRVRPMDSGELEAMLDELQGPAPRRNGVSPRANGTAPRPQAPAPPVPAPQAKEAEPAPGGRAQEVLGESREVSATRARTFVQEFDNQDKDYQKGLNKLNRWVASEGSGTPFQWRGDRAYLNLGGISAAGIRNYDEQLTTRMGFSRRLGRLVVPGLEGEVVVYERP